MKQKGNNYYRQQNQQVDPNIYLGGVDTLVRALGGTLPLLDTVRKTVLLHFGLHLLLLNFYLPQPELLAPAVYAEGHEGLFEFHSLLLGNALEGESRC